MPVEAHLLRLLTWFSPAFPVGAFGFSHGLETAIREELARAVRDGFGADEVEEGKVSVLQARRLARSQDRALASRLSNYLFVKRSFAWDIDFEKKIAALTPAQVNAALRKHIDPARLSVMKAGDFR